MSASLNQPAYPLEYDGTPEGALDAPLNWICRSLTGGVSYKKTTGLGVRTGWVATAASDQTAANTLNARTPITEVFPISGTALHALANGIANAVTFTAPALILRTILDITTIATGACTFDIGYSATTLATSDTLLDGIDVHVTGVSDSMNAALDTGTNAFAQKAASGKYITIDEKTGDATGLVGNLYVTYIFI